MPDSSPILECLNVTTVPDSWYDVPAANLNCTLNAGELAMIRFDHHSPRLPLADLAMGLAELESGTVSFLGKDWNKLSPTDAAAQRGQIGRLFGTTGWAHHLDIDENITLRQRHHTHRSLAEIEQEASLLARDFGLTFGLPQTRPGNLDQHDLQRAACVRMLVGSPPLVVVDEDASGFYADVLHPLVEHLNAARSSGAAVLWLTADADVWNEASIRPTLQCEFGQLTDSSATASVHRE